MSVLGILGTIKRKLKELWEMLRDRLFWRIFKEQVKDSFSNPVGM